MPRGKRKTTESDGFKPVATMLQFYGVWKPEVELAAFGGLKVERVKDGVFRISLSGGKSLVGMISTQVQTADPWCNEKTMVAIKSCQTHGLQCPSLSADMDRDEDVLEYQKRFCKVVDVGVLAPRWHPVVRSIEVDKGSAEIVLYRGAKCTTLAEALAAPPPEPADAGFYVMVMMQPEPAKTEGTA